MGRKCRALTDAQVSRLKADTKTDWREQAKSAIATVIFDKERWPAPRARKWLADNDFSQEKKDETEKSLRFRQFPPSQCVAGSFVALTRDVPAGITLVSCRRREQESELFEAVAPRADGSCPAGYPIKARDPKSGKTMCFKGSPPKQYSAAMHQVERIQSDTINLRAKDFPGGKCSNCRYWVADQAENRGRACKIVTEAAAELVCDAFQGAAEAVPPYEVRDEDWLAFVEGMVKDQPYQHVVLGGFLTPEGPIVIIKDTMKPEAHTFSLSKDFHIAHTTNEHHWTQEEVDRTIAVGKTGMMESVDDGEAWAERAARHVTKHYCEGWGKLDEKTREFRWTVGLIDYGMNFENLEDNRGKASNWMESHGFKYAAMILRRVDT